MTQQTQHGGMLESTIRHLCAQIKNLRGELAKSPPVRKWIRTPGHLDLVEAIRITHRRIREAARAASDFFSYGGRGYIAGSSSEIRLEIRKLEAISEEIGRHKLDDMSYTDLHELGCDLIDAGDTYDLDLKLLVAEERKATEHPPPPPPNLRNSFDRPPTGGWVN